MCCFVSRSIAKPEAAKWLNVTEPRQKKPYTLTNENAPSSQLPFSFTLASHYAHSLPKSERYHVTKMSCRVPLGTVEHVNPVGKHQLDGTSALLEGDVPEGLFFIRWQAIYELLVYRALGTHPQSFNLCCSSCLLSYTQLDPHRRMVSGRAEGDSWIEAKRIKNLNPVFKSVKLTKLVELIPVVQHSTIRY